MRKAGSPPFSSEHPVPGAGTPGDTTAVRLDVDGLRVARNDRIVFSELSFSLRPGQLLQVEGPNGSGKTTLLRALCGLTPFSGGKILWCGESVGDVYPDFVADIAYIGHTAAVNGDMTPLENLHAARALIRSRTGVQPQDALARLGLPFELEETPCRQLSAGQRRRVALARLLLCDARLWLLDEPFTALDSGGRAQVEERLIEHAQRGGMAVFSTHHAMQLDGCAVRTLHLS